MVEPVKPRLGQEIKCGRCGRKIFYKTDTICRDCREADPVFMRMMRPEEEYVRPTNRGRRRGEYGAEPY